MKKTYQSPLARVCDIHTESFLCAASPGGEPQLDTTLTDKEEITSQDEILSKGTDFGLWTDEEEDE